MIEKTKFFQWLVTYKSDFEGDVVPVYNLYIKIGSLLVRHMLQAMSSGVDIPHKDYYGAIACEPLESFTTNITYVLSKVNHSCIPNAVLL